MVIDVGEGRAMVCVAVITALVMQLRLVLIIHAHHTLIRLLTVYQFGDHLTILLV